MAICHGGEPASAGGYVTERRISATAVSQPGLHAASYLTPTSNQQWTTAEGSRENSFACAFTAAGHWFDELRAAARTTAAVSLLCRNIPTHHQTLKQSVNYTCHPLKHENSVYFALTMNLGVVYNSHNKQGLFPL
jgi:hypothetical protein